MTATAKVTSKGQITIPKVIRDTLGLREGSVVAFEPKEGEAILRRAKTIRDFRGSLKVKGRTFDVEEARRAAKAHVARKVMGRG